METRTGNTMSKPYKALAEIFKAKREGTETFPNGEYVSIGVAEKAALMAYEEGLARGREQLFALYLSDSREFGRLAENEAAGFEQT
jgi:hypothetical protein